MERRSSSLGTSKRWITSTVPMRWVRLCKIMPRGPESCFRMHLRPNFFRKAIFCTGHKLTDVMACFIGRIEFRNICGPSLRDSSSRTSGSKNKCRAAFASPSLRESSSRTSGSKNKCRAAFASPSLRDSSSRTSGSKNKCRAAFASPSLRESSSRTSGSKNKCRAAFASPSLRDSSSRTSSSKNKCRAASRHHPIPFKTRHICTL